MTVLTVLPLSAPPLLLLLLLLLVSLSLPHPSTGEQYSLSIPLEGEDIGASAMSLRAFPREEQQGGAHIVIRGAIDIAHFHPSAGSAAATLALLVLPFARAEQLLSDSLAAVEDLTEDQTAPCAPLEDAIKDAGAASASLWHFAANQSRAPVDVSLPILSRDDHTLVFMRCNYKIGVARNPPSDQATASPPTIYLHATAALVHPWGQLPVRLRGKLPYMSWVAGLYVLLLCVWGGVALAHRASLHRVHGWLALALSLGLLEALLSVADLETYNSSGLRNLSLWYAVLVATAVKKTAARALVLVTSIGLAITRAELPRKHKRTLVALAALYLPACLGYDMLQQRQQFIAQRRDIDDRLNSIFAGALACVDSAWFYYVLNALLESTDHVASKRQHVKLQLFKRIRVILLLAAFVSAGFAIFDIVLTTSKWGQQQFELQWLVDALWEMQYVFLLLCFAGVFLPGSRSKEYAHFQQLSVDEQQDDEEYMPSSGSGATGAAAGEEVELGGLGQHDDEDDGDDEDDDDDDEDLENGGKRIPEVRTGARGVHALGASSATASVLPPRDASDDGEDDSAGFRSASSPQRPGRPVTKPAAGSSRRDASNPFSSASGLQLPRVDDDDDDDDDGRGAGAGAGGEGR